VGILSGEPERRCKAVSTIVAAWCLAALSACGPGSPPPSAAPDATPDELSADHGACTGRGPAENHDEPTAVIGAVDGWYRVLSTPAASVAVGRHDVDLEVANVEADRSDGSSSTLRARVHSQALEGIDWAIRNGHTAYVGVAAVAETPHFVAVTAVRLTAGDYFFAGPCARDLLYRPLLAVTGGDGLGDVMDAAIGKTGQALREALPG
jgi:hypothetical protein